jgi:hypothetical protein
MNWNPFEFITETKEDYTNILSAMEDKSVSVDTNSGVTVIEVGIGKSAIIRVMEHKNTPNEPTKKRGIAREQVEI